MTAQSSARELVTVAGRAIEKLEYEGNPVITLKMIDELHGRPAGTARRNFNANRKQFQSREDFVVITTLDEFRTTGARHNPNGLTLFTESGYLKLVKTFTDDLAWQVQGQLVECYFRVKHEIQQTPSIPSDPVLTMLAVMQDLRKAQISLSEQNQVLAVGLAETRHDLAKFVEERRLENWQQANILFPENLLVQLMRTCRNLAPVQWLSAQVGGLFIAGGQKNFAEALVKEIVKGSKGLRFHRVQTLMEAAGIRG